MDELDEHARRQQQDLAAIKAKRQQVIDALVRGDKSVEPGQFLPNQLGLRWIMADGLGRLWRDDGDRLTLIFRPQESDDVYDGK